MIRQQYEEGSFPALAIAVITSSSMEGMPVRIESTESLADGLLSLEEPWRSRFLYLLASRAADSNHTGHPATREDVSRWLRDRLLREEISSLLDVWLGSRPRHCSSNTSLPR